MRHFKDYFSLFFQNNKLVSILLLVILLAKIAYMFGTLGSNSLYDDGWYYSSIARSLLEGKGYANPFGGVDTGPTAWVPPLFSFLIAGVFKTIGDNSFGLFTLMTIQMAGLSLAFYLLLKAWDLTKLSKNNLIILVIYLFLIFSYQIHFIKMINDIWIYILCFSLCLFAIINYINTSKSLGILLFLALFIPLAAPVIALPFVLSMVLLFVSEFAHTLKIKHVCFFPKASKPRFLPIILIGALFILSSSIWGIRNYMVFNKFIVTKSNAWFEMYLANVADNDGILSESTVEKFHPDRNREQYRESIKLKGEVLWIKDFEDISRKYLYTHKSEYYQKMLNRAKNIFLFSETDNDDEKSDFFKNIPASTLEKLHDNFLVHDNHWVCLYEDSLLIKSKLQSEAPENYMGLYHDWQKSKTGWYATKYSNRFLFTGFFVALVPLLCLIFLFVVFYKTVKTFVLILSVMYLSYTLPYILISHEIRYQEPLFGLQSILISITCMWIVNKIFCSNRKFQSNKS